MVDKQFASVNNVPPEPRTGQDTRDRGMRCLIAPHFLALSNKGKAGKPDRLAAEPRPSLRGYGNMDYRQI